MRNFIERYTIELETIGPVHIGSGDTLRKNQWILDRGRNEAIMLDFSKFITYLQKRNLIDAYESYLMDKRPASLFKWFSEHGIHQREMADFTSYTLDVSGLNLKNGNIRDMQLAMKDPYGRPYIPGSTLKGAIRNVLLAKRLTNQEYDAKDIIREIKTFSGRQNQFLDREKNKLNMTIFHTKGIYEKKQQAVNDMMSGIRISDSNAVDVNLLTLCQKLDMRTDGKESELPTVRECIKPGTTFTFDLTIDRTETDVTIDEIKEAIKAFLDDYNKMFLEKFSDEELYRDNVIYLGGGTGFPSKTVLHQILRKDKDRVKLVGAAIDQTLPKSMKRHSKDHIKGVSPTVVKLTEIDGTLLQMGPCKIDIYSV